MNTCSINNSIFIVKSKLKHGDKYDYSLVNYVNNKTKVKIICPIHKEFEQRADKHYQGYGCKKCATDLCKRNYSKTNLKFTIDAKLVHYDKYDYSLVEYINNKIKVKIICEKHGKFEQTPNHHLKGRGCPKCSLSNMFLSRENLINKANLKHNNKYSYGNLNYTTVNTKIIVNCPIHGSFNPFGYNHLNGHGCPICKESKGEKKIRELLVYNNIKFIPQYKFKDCKNILPLPFDFYLPEYNTCIEYQGIQHYEPISCFGGENAFNLTLVRDRIKYDYCKTNKINLTIIKYSDTINISFDKTKEEIIIKGSKTKNK